MMQYASFGQRLLGRLLDFLILLPGMALFAYLQSHSKAWAYLLTAVWAALCSGYFIYGHGRHGQTPGQRIMGIRLLKVSGQSIGWKEAWLRNSVDILFGLVAVVAGWMALSRISDAQFTGVGLLQQTQNLTQHQPSWFQSWNILVAVWTWGEFLVMLTNEKRRALHDFLAGTVVVSEARPAETAVQTA